MITAITLPVLMGVAGAGLEFTRAMQVKSDLQNSADAALLAAATEARISEGKASIATIEDAAKRYIANQFGEEMTEEERKTFEDSIPLVSSYSDTSKGKTFKISTTLAYDMPLNPLLGFIGADTLKLSVTSSTESSFNNGAALSMYLVLDRSGSMSFRTDTRDTSKRSCQNYTMNNWGYYPNLDSSSPCYVNKSTSLKTAVSYLVDTLNKSDPSYKSSGSPESTFIRTAAIGYSDVTYVEQAMGWGTKTTNQYVQQIPQYPTGGTNASAALKKAVDALKSNNGNTATTTEGKAHEKAKNSSYERYIVLMTDGEMTGSSSSWNSTVDAQVRATCTAAKADDIKIFTVAFMAPDRGKALLEACASSKDNYFAPENMEQIVAAFGTIARKAASTISRQTH